jgi:hypothetical protein
MLSRSFVLKSRQFIVKHSMGISGEKIHVNIDDFTNLNVSKRGRRRKARDQ